MLGPTLFNIFINHLFFHFVNSHVCNFADDTTLTACGIGIRRRFGFENNYLQLNESKFHRVVPPLSFLYFRPRRIWGRVVSHKPFIAPEDAHIKNIFPKS